MVREAKDAGASMTSPQPLLEQLAEIEHEQWVCWSKEVAATERIGQNRIERWRSFWCPYKYLPEFIKEMDRKWARKVFETILGDGRGEVLDEKKRRARIDIIIEEYYSNLRQQGERDRG